MKWPTWDQAFAVAALAGCGWLMTRARRERLADALAETFRICGLYGIWRLARQLPLTAEAGALERGRSIHDVQRFLPLPTELTLQSLVVTADWAAHLTNWYYSIVHVPALVVFMIWLFVRHRDRYPRWRNSLVVATAGCLVIRFVRVAPPRFYPDLGFVDLSSELGFSPYGAVGTGVSDQFAAMPSIHVAWASIVALGAVDSTTSRWRWVIFAHLPITLFVVMATAHHWWLDGLVAIALVGVGVASDAGIRRIRNHQLATTETAPTQSTSQGESIAARTSPT